ncbi:MAG: hypothetical protein BAJATHORv1_60079 [Candidatus Thorarchaeota archaeon]|nr:MAG: hypothetical protein BAJATHORv1_60079 [Candidatus Thorarchaeota archaeon]
MSQRKSGFARIVRTLVTRGHTIYGREKLVDVFAESGLELIDGYPPENPDLIALTKFLVEYAKLSPAAKLTLLILARQQNVELPKDIMKEEKRFFKFG